MHPEVEALVHAHDLPPPVASDLDALFTRWFASGPTSARGAALDAEAMPSRYEDVGQIGVGGMGEVRRVRDRELGRTCAYKAIRADLASKPKVVARFVEESQIGAQLQHPNIPPVYDGGRLGDGRPWFTMKEVRGRTFGEVIREAHRGEVTEAALRRLGDVLEKVCDAVGYAHGRGVVHRDLKPDNVMVGSHGEVFVLDWGLAKVVGRPDLALGNGDLEGRVRSAVAFAAMTLLALLPLSVTGCGRTTADTCEGDRLFGVPNANTGLGEDACGPTCSCGGEEWSPPAYTDADLRALRAWVLQTPYEALTADPYAAPLPPREAPGEDPVCAVEARGPDRYVLRDAPTPRDAEREGRQVTHFGPCGVCSTLQDLAVYVEQPDLTEPVRTCGLEHWAHPLEDLVACIEALGFTHPCAQVWAYNTLATRTACGAVCLSALDEPYHQPDGTLNACLQCDEDESGAVFLAVAGRTRRNTGVPSSMCRPCSEVRPVEHRYRAP